MTLEETIQEMFQTPRKKWEFTLENGSGETYRNNSPTLYGHSTYERSSVLAGSPQRVFVHKWDSWEEAREEVAALSKKIRKFKCSDSGSTHIPSEVLTRHLPDSDDF